MRVILEKRWLKERRSGIERRRTPEHGPVTLVLCAIHGQRRGTDDRRTGLERRTPRPPAIRLRRR
jgi:hypothetical protein